MKFFRKKGSRPARVVNGQATSGYSVTEHATQNAGATGTAVDLSHYSGGADRIVVIDTETTGVLNSDRVVEIALVTLDLQGVVTEVWETLVHPQRAVSATEIHGINASMVDVAPRFEELAGDVAIRLEGACLAGHNLSFDLRMLSMEFERLGADLTVTAGLCTLEATNMKLKLACELHEIRLIEAHSARGDALATAELLTKVISRCEGGSPAAAPVHLQRSGRVLRRNATTPVTIPDPSFIARLAEQIDYSGLEAKVLDYALVAERAIADLHFDSDERALLRQLGIDLGLTDAQIANTHRQLIGRLVEKAIADSVVTLDEHDALVRAASALDVDQADVERRIDPYLRRHEELRIAEGMSVVFTGGREEEQEENKRIAEAMGLIVGTGVNMGSKKTKKTDLLAAVDALSASDKAKKARRYGVPIVAVDDLIKAKLGDMVPVVNTTASSLKVVTCPDCHQNWTISATSGGHQKRRCADCA